MRISRLIAPLLLAFHPVHALALQLGELKVESQPGAPFAASVPVIAQPGEQYEYGVYSVRVFQERAADGTVLRNITGGVSIMLFTGSSPHVSITGPATRSGAFIALTVDARLGTSQSRKEYLVPPGATSPQVVIEPARPVVPASAMPMAPESDVTPVRTPRLHSDGYWDLRLGATFEPPLSDADYDSNGFKASGSWDAPGGMVELTASHRFASGRAHSGFIKFGGYYAGFSGDTDPESDTTIKLRSAGGHIGGGYSFRSNGVFSLEAGPTLAIGYASAEETTPGIVEDYTANGASVRFGGGVTSLFTFGGFQLGVGAGVASWLTFVNYDARDVFIQGQQVHVAAVDATYKGTMVYAGVSIGFRN